MIQILRLTEGYLGSNTYIIYDDRDKDCAVIDAGNDTEELLPIIEKHGLTVRYIILTHGHYDHISFMEEYKKAFPDAVICIHSLDNEILPNPRLNASCLFGPERAFPRADKCLEEGDELSINEYFTLTIFHTPGHTQGGICIQCDGFLFTGDTLFYNGFGRTDLGCGSTRKLSESIDRIYSMNPDLVVLPGHGTRTTVGREARENPFLDF